MFRQSIISTIDNSTTCKTRVNLILRIGTPTKQRQCKHSIQFTDTDAQRPWDHTDMHWITQNSATYKYQCEAGCDLHKISCLANCYEISTCLKWHNITLKHIAKTLNGKFRKLKRGAFCYGICIPGKSNTGAYKCSANTNWNMWPHILCEECALSIYFLV